ncbi:MAG TPA: hypothetical protein VHT27_04550 [Solirubrobacteraceae bacterium]|nr:hypothetical protein [Solirubrobacteraceae bacterium]
MAPLRLAGGATGCLAVETKVDSAWSPGQLEATTPEDAHGVLLAVGYTALMVTPSDVARLDAYAQPWSLVGPREWAAIVRAAAGQDEAFTSYAKRLDVEAAEHERARECVRLGRPVDFGRHGEALEHWAYFTEVAAHAGKERRWERKTLISGPLQTLWLKEWPDESGAYLELMGQGRGRTLCAKVWGSHSALAGRQRVIAEGLAGLDGTAGKRSSARAKTCTARRWSLERRTPAEAAELVERLAHTIERAHPQDAAWPDSVQVSTGE